MPTSIRWSLRTRRRWLTQQKGSVSWWTRGTALRCVYLHVVFHLYYSVPLGVTHNFNIDLIHLLNFFFFFYR